MAMVAKVWSGSAFAWLGLALSVAASHAEQASAPPAPSGCVARQSAYQAQETQDGELVKNALAAVNQGGFPALKQQLAILEEVLGRAPASFEKQTCDGSAAVRGDDLASAILSSAMAANNSPTKRAVLLGPLPYPTAALLVGAWYVENGDWPRAERSLSKGLELAPTHPKLTSEDALTLSRLGRFQEALAICDRTLAGAPLLQPIDRARILRARGYALGELKRYDEAEAAYRESLKYEPNHAGALNELVYISQQKAGAPPTRTVTLTSDKAKITTPGH